MSKNIIKLNKKHYKKNGGTKYFINCSDIDLEKDSILLEKSLKNQNDISIIKAVINYKKHVKKNKHIVIKIAHNDRTNKKEYDISKTLQQINGFIKYICLFNCFDDTYYYINDNKKLPDKICTANNIEQNNNIILIAPYITGGSIRNYKWNLENIHILKSLLKQSIMSLTEAYIKFGFLHNDLHLDNILLKKTKIKEIVYDNATIDTNGYKIIIMDFDSSFIGVDTTKSLQAYWLNIGNMLSRITFDLGHSILPDTPDDKINYFIRYAIHNNLDSSESIRLLHLIDDLNFTLATSFIVSTYNPNII